VFRIDGVLTPPFCSYVGEVGIWTGIWALASASLPVGSVVATAASPLFTWFLLRKVRALLFRLLDVPPTAHVCRSRVFRRSRRLEIRSSVAIQNGRNTKGGCFLWTRWTVSDCHVGQECSRLLALGFKELRLGHSSVLVILILRL
jgi:hypothetical protein